MARVTNAIYKNFFFSSERDTWETPDALFRAIDARYGPFDHDVAALRRSRKVDSYLGPDHIDPRRRDALATNWRGRCWCNPPYGTDITSEWIRYAWHQAWRGNASTVLIVPARIGYGWFKQLAARANKMVLLLDRVSFDGIGPAPFGSMLLIFEAMERNPDGSIAQWPMDRFPEVEFMYVPAAAQGRKNGDS